MRADTHIRINKISREVKMYVAAARLRCTLGNGEVKTGSFTTTERFRCTLEQEGSDVR